MLKDSTAAKVVIIVLAIVGVLVLLSAFGMLFMPGSMTGGSRVSGLFSIVGIRRGIMGM